MTVSLDCDSLCIMRDMACEHGQRAYLVLWRENCDKPERTSVQFARGISEARSKAAAWLLNTYGSGHAAVLGAVELK